MALGQCGKAVCDRHAQNQGCGRWRCGAREGPDPAGLCTLRKDFEFYAILSHLKAIPLFYTTGTTSLLKRIDRRKVRGDVWSPEDQGGGRRALGGRTDFLFSDS